MNISQFNFQHADWLWALAFLPALWLVSRWAPKPAAASARLERFADKHLLPHLVTRQPGGGAGAGRGLLFWSLLLGFGILALAGPRWDYREVPSFLPRKDLLIALDLSTSMDATDVRPSRLVRAKQKIEDILNENPGVNVGLIAFAADAHLVAPLTQDKEAVRYLLSALRTDLVYVPGSRVAPALDLAGSLFRALPPGEEEKAVLLLSDGDFEDAGSAATGAAAALAASGIRVNALGLGTPEGAPVPLEGGALQKSERETVLSRRNDSLLGQIARAGSGHVFTLTAPVGQSALFSRPISSGDFRTASHAAKDWEPRFYLFLVPAMLLLAYAFRRNPLLAKVRRSALRSPATAALLVLLLAAGGGNAQAAAATALPSANFGQFFKNRDLRAKEALEQKKLSVSHPRIPRSLPERSGGVSGRPVRTSRNIIPGIETPRSCPRRKV